MSPEKQQARQRIEKFFRETALKKNQEQQKTSFEDLFAQNGNKRYLFLLKESIGDLFIATSLFRSIKEQYPDHDLYVACDPSYHEMFDGNPYVFRVLPYYQEMESELFCTGQGSHKGFVNVYCHVGVATQRILSYLTNKNLALDLNYETR